MDRADEMEFGGIRGGEKKIVVVGLAILSVALAGALLYGARREPPPRAPELAESQAPVLVTDASYRIETRDEGHLFLLAFAVRPSPIDMLMPEVRATVADTDLELRAVLLPRQAYDSDLYAATQPDRTGLAAISRGEEFASPCTRSAAGAWIWKLSGRINQQSKSTTRINGQRRRSQLPSSRSSICSQTCLVADE